VASGPPYSERHLSAQDGLQLYYRDYGNRLSRRLRIITMDPSVAADYILLKAELDHLEDDRGVCLNRLFYLAIPPNIYGPVVDNLGASGLTAGCQHGVADARLLIDCACERA